jgi:hypothetical protein
MKQEWKEEWENKKQNFPENFEQTGPLFLENFGQHNSGRVGNAAQDIVPKK